MKNISNEFFFLNISLRTLCVNMAWMVYLYMFTYLRWKIYDLLRAVEEVIGIMMTLDLQKH